MGKFIQLPAPGNSRPRACSAIGGGAAIMQVMIERALQLGVLFKDQFAAHKLLKTDQEILGATFYNSVGRICHITATSVILCAGGATGLFRLSAVIQRLLVMVYLDSSRRRSEQPRVY